MNHSCKNALRYPLRAASENGQVEVVNMLIQAGEEVNAQIDENGWLDEMGFTPLHFASSNGHLEVVNILIQEGGDVNSQSRWGETPLYLASMRGHVEVIIALLAAGADKTIYNMGDGDTPYTAAKN